MLEADISVSVTSTLAPGGRADLDNFNKLAFDSLTDIAYEDDNQIAELLLRRAYDKSRPRIAETVT